MRPSHLPLAVITVLLACGSAGLAADSASTKDAQVRLAQGSTVAPAEWPDTVELTEADIKGMITVGEKLRDLGVKLRREEDGSLSVGESADANAEVMATIRSAGFTPESLQQVAFSVGLALAAVEGTVDATRQGIQQYEQMKPQIPPQQWAAFEANISRMQALLERLENQPPNNKVLAELYQDELRRALDPN